MNKRLNGVGGVALGLLLLSGCATGRNYQTDIDSLNARISTLQGQLAAKDEEISRLQNQEAQQQTALTQAETGKQMLSEKLDAALAELESRSKKSKVAPRKEESDLK